MCDDGSDGNLLLPGELRDAPDGRRSPRDWIVDVVLFVFAAAVGAALLADDVVRTTATLAGRARHRRRGRGAAWRCGSGARTRSPSPCSPVGGLSRARGGRGLVALFNAALRAPRRSFAAIVALCACRPLSSTRCCIRAATRT